MSDNIIELVRYPTRADLRRGIVLSGAAEQMFFFGAPLAHIVAHEQWQRDERLRQTYRRQARLARRAGLPVPPQPFGLRL